MDTKANKLISILMPAYNAEAHINESIDSILAQTYGDWELIVIDDGSVDSTRELVRQYDDPRVRLVETSHQGCTSKVLNMGMRAARGEYIAFLDADDRFTPDSLAIRADYLNQHSDCTAVFGTYLNFGPFKPSKPIKLPPINWENILLGKLPHQRQSLLARRETLERIGAFEESIRIADDHIFYIKLFLDSFTGVQAIPVCVYHYRHTLGGISRGSQKTRLLLDTLPRNFDWMFRIADIPIPDKEAVESRVRSSYYSYYCWTRLQSHANDQVRLIAQAWQKDSHILRPDRAGSGKYLFLSRLPFRIER